MALFRRNPPVTAVEPVPRSAPWALWADSLGRVAIRGLQILIVVAVAAGVVIALRSVTIVTIPIVLALILACALAPLMNGMRRRGVPSIVATLVALVGILVVLGGVAWLIVLAVRDQWDELSSQATEGFDALLTWARQLPFFPTQEEIDGIVEDVTAFLTSAQFGSGALAGVSAVGSLLAGLVLMVTILFFFLKDGPRIWEFLLRPFRGEQEARARRVGTKTVEVFGSYVRGTATVALVDALGIFLGLVILGVPLALPLAVLVFLFAFVPIVGAVVAGALAALVALVANGWVNALLVVGVVVLVNQLEGNLLQPVLMGRSMKLHALVVLIALAVGAGLGGILGAVLAVPITAAVWGAIQVWDGPGLPARWARPRPSEAAAD